MAGFPELRMRRLRRTETLRRMVREHRVSVDDLICPLFVVPGEGVRQEIDSMPGCFYFSVDRLVEECKVVRDLGIPAILLFGISESKDTIGSSAWASDGIVQKAVGAVADQVRRLEIITDVCLCGYTEHAHCGPVCDGVVDNDAALKLLAKVAVTHVRAGATMVAPSDMMDGRVGAIRTALDREGFSHLPIMSYAAKYASAFYGPFRDAAQSAPSSGDRRGYQMDPANAQEALEEVRLDLEEGADIVMVKPALAYLDIIHRVKETFHRPVAAYNVSGEYAMVKMASKAGLLDEKRAVMEMLTSFKRAGGDLIVTYFARDVAQWLKDGME